LVKPARRLFSRSSGISFCISTDRPPCNAATTGRGQVEAVIRRRRDGCEPPPSDEESSPSRGDRISPATRRALLFEFIADDADIVLPQLPLLRLDVGWHVGSLHGTPISQPSVAMVKPEVNFRSRINTGPAAPRHWRQATLANVIPQSAKRPVKALTDRSACSSMWRQPMGPRFRPAISAAETRGKRDRSF
jgi:hypothetical protein